ncbi:MAG: hypothetical protein WDZ83_06320 [Rhizobiaceae bacterium]
MTGYEKSPDYGDRHPDRGWSLRTWGVIWILGTAAAIYLFL